MKSATVADLGLRASLARVARRKVPALNLRAGTSLWHRPAAVLGQRPPCSTLCPKHTLHLWSVDGQFACEGTTERRSEQRADPWLFSSWKRPVRIDFLLPYLIAEGFPVADAQVVYRHEADSDSWPSGNSCGRDHRMGEEVRRPREPGFQ